MFYAGADNLSCHVQGASCASLPVLPGLAHPSRPLAIYSRALLQEQLALRSGSSSLGTKAGKRGRRAPARAARRHQEKAERRTAALRYFGIAEEMPAVAVAQETAGSEEEEEEDAEAAAADEEDDEDDEDSDSESTSDGADDTVLRLEDL